jgi:hypothetical protein
MNWVAIIAIVLSLVTAGCADTADAEDSAATTPAETQKEARTNLASDDTTWIAIVMTWRPVNYTIDKEFSSEVNCWNYYDNGAGESKMLNNYGTQVLDHQGNKPDKGFHFGTNENREYPTRLYHGITTEQGQVWLTCDLKGRYKDL